MDSSLFSDDDSLPTFQEGDILTFFEEKSQIIDCIEKDVDNSYSHRLISFLKNESSKTSQRNSFLDQCDQNQCTQIQSIGLTENQQTLIKEIPNSSQKQSDDMEGEQQMKGSLKRSIEKKSLAIPSPYLQQKQQLQQNQNTQRNYDKFDRPPLSQRFDTRSNLKNTLTLHNNDFQKQNNTQSLLTLTAKDDNENFFNPFRKEKNEQKIERGSLSLGSSKEGRLSTQKIINCQQEIQKETVKYPQKHNQCKENINPNIKVDCTSQMKTIDTDEKQIQKIQTLGRNNQKSHNINQRQNSITQYESQQESCLKDQNNDVITTLNQNSDQSSCDKQSKMNDLETNTDNTEQQGIQCQIKNQTTNNLKINSEKETDLQEFNSTNIRQNNESNDVLDIVYKIRKVKSEIDDINKIINQKKKALQSQLHKQAVTIQKNSENDLNVLKKLTASTLFLNNKYDEMVQNYQDYILKQESLQPLNQNCGGDSPQDTNNLDQNSFSKYSVQNSLSQNIAQVRNVSQTQIYSNCKNQSLLNQDNYIKQSSSHNIVINLNNPSQLFDSHLNPSVDQNKISDNFKNQLNLNNQNQRSENTSIDRTSQIKDRITINQLASSRLTRQYSSKKLFQNENVLIEQENGESSDPQKMQNKLNNFKFSTSCREMNSNENNQQEQQNMNINTFQIEHNKQMTINQSQCNQSNNIFTRAKSQEQKQHLNLIENSLICEQQQQQSSKQKTSQTATIQNLVSKLSLDKHTNKLNRLLSIHPFNSQSLNKEQKTINSDSQQIKQQSNTPLQNTTIVSVQPLSKIVQRRNTSQQQMNANQLTMNEQKQKYMRSYSYQEKHAIQKLMQTHNSSQQKQE